MTTRPVMLVAGTRPEIVKLASLRLALTAKKVPFKFVWTGQQTDLGDDAFRVFKIRPDVRLHLDRVTGTLPELFSRLAAAMPSVFERVRPSWVVTQGDTLSALVATQQAFLAGIPTAHVEAGLRSWDTDSPYPEEACRVWMDAVANVKFAPTQQASMTLDGEVYVTGQTGIDALKLVAAKRLRKGAYAVVTMHRRENADGIKEVANTVRWMVQEKILDLVVWPVHPNPISAKVVPGKLGKTPGVELTKPLPYDQMVNLLRHAKLILTDSGGIQEEALALHVPCLVLRENTERPEGVQTGGAVLVGTNADKIAGWTQWLLANPDEYDKMATAANPYGDGRAGARIAEVLKAKLEGRKPRKAQAQWSGPK